MAVLVCMFLSHRINIQHGLNNLTQEMHQKRAIFITNSRYVFTRSFLSSVR